MACVRCGIPILSEGVELCPHHVGAMPDNWAKFNKAVCDFIHRGVPLAPAVGLFAEIAREREEALTVIARERTGQCQPTVCD